MARLYLAMHICAFFFSLYDLDVWLLLTFLADKICVFCGLGKRILTIFLFVTLFQKVFGAIFGLQWWLSLLRQIFFFSFQSKLWSVQQCMLFGTRRMLDCFVGETTILGALHLLVEFLIIMAISIVTSMNLS